MQKKSVILAGLLGGLTAIVMIGLTYLGDQLAGLPFVPYDLFDWMARHLPGGFINFSIDTMVRVISGLKLGPTASTAKMAEHGIALLQFVIAGIILGLILGVVGNRRPDRLILSGLLLGGIFGLGMIYIETTLRFPSAGPLFSSLWLMVIFLGWGAVLGRLIRDVAFQPLPGPQVDLAPESQNGLSRRQFLYLVGAGSVTILVSAGGLRFLRQTPSTASASLSPTGTDLPEINNTSGPAASPPQRVLVARFKPVSGTRPELTPTENFYRIDIDAEAPQIDGNTWRLVLDGLVEKPLSLSLADIRSRVAVTQAITLSCISNEIGGDLISTALWTGVPFKNILADAGLKPEVKEIAITAADGFYESVPVDEAMDDRTLLVYAMNGEPLTADHGFPLRIYIPNHYGMKQPKWIMHMEAIDHEGAGYWVDRGWSPTATVRTTSVVDNIAADQADPQSGIVPVGGIAYAGAQGISKVELQVDEGAWEMAELRDPPLSPLTWVQWRYLWKATPGRHVVRVRAYNGAGALQETTPRPTFPNGSTGVDSLTTDIQN